MATKKYSKNYNVNNSFDKEIEKRAKNFFKKHPVLTFVIIVILIAVLVGGYFAYDCYMKKKLEGEISFHFLMLGNEFAGDSIYIKAGNNDILIDAGSRTGSTDTIKNYIDKYCTDGILEYVIATHADRDHIACFGNEGGIFDSYICKTIIDFPRSDANTVTYSNYLAKREKEVEEGAVHYTALDCYNNVGNAKRIYNLSDTISMEILYNYYYEHKDDDENNYSVCVMFRHGNRQFLFTGDLELEGEQKLAEKYPSLGQVELYKAGHHGSKTSSNDCLLNIIQPKICVVSCNAGNTEYTDVNENTFPTQLFINRISKFTTKVYVTTLADHDFTGGENYVAMNGNIVITSNKEEVKVSCSNNQTLLKDTAWFKTKREYPTNWS